MSLRNIRGTIIEMPPPHCPPPSCPPSPSPLPPPPNVTDRHFCFIYIYGLHMKLFVGYSKAPEQSQSSARPVCQSHTMTSTGREPATIPTAAYRSSQHYALRHGRRHGGWAGQICQADLKFSKHSFHFTPYLTQAYSFSWAEYLGTIFWEHLQLLHCNQYWQGTGTRCVRQT